MPEDNRNVHVEHPPVPVESLLREVSKRLVEMTVKSPCSAIRQVLHHVDCAVQVLDDNAKAIAERTAKKEPDG